MREMSEMDEREKYVVVKFHDVGVMNLQTDAPAILTLHPGDVLDDAVVIRLQDRFAHVALYAYANAIRDTMEVMEELGVEVPEGLGDVADRMAALADEARMRKAAGGTKMPD